MPSADSSINKPHTGVTAIIQARMNSSRLPGKALLNLAGRPMISHVIERIKATEGVDRTVLATCHGDENMPLVSIAESMGIDVFVGSMDNVLERFYLAAEKFGGEYIMRVTADNPFTDPHYASMTIRMALSSGADICYISNLPLGTGVGMIKKSALDIAYRKSDRNYQLEHVTPYIKEHPELFVSEAVELDELGSLNPFKGLRLTVDTEEDYNLANIIYDNLFTGIHFSLHDIIAFLIKNPDLLSINRSVEQRPMTQSSF